MENALQAVILSVLLLSIIFLVVIILIFTIKLLVYLLPHKTPLASSTPSPARPATQRAATGSEEAEHLAAITGALANHLGRNPDELQISKIKVI